LASLAVKGNPKAFSFPRPLLKEGLQFSFSGLKTAVLQTIQSFSDETCPKADIAASFEAAVVDTLITKSIRALEKTGFKQLVIAGGVGANHSLREKMAHACEAKGYRVFYPRPEFCTDNGAMIAFAACQRLLAGQRSDELRLRARWPLTELSPI
jgi:N6-L-threonylcarbamoyladenine synthase